MNSMNKNPQPPQPHSPRVVAITVSGAGGRMGGRIIALGAVSDQVRIVGALEAAGHPAIGKDAGIVAGVGECKIAVTSWTGSSGDAAHALDGADVLIEFSSPAATIEHARLAAAKGTGAGTLPVGLVIGTTGLTSKDEEILKEIAKSLPMIVAPNMSIGVNLLFKIAPMMARTLGPDYDIEIIEAHHNKKKDAPSGTALGLLDGLLEARGNSHGREQAVYGRRGGNAARAPGEIGVHAVRGGDIIGEHTIYFVGNGERIELTHRAASRDTFALGALRAAVFLAGKPAGRYTMEDVLF